MTVPPPLLRLLMLIGLGFFLGLAFEDFYARAHQKRPGGIRTFPLLALAGALLYLLDPARLLPVCAGLLTLGAWLTCYYWQHARETDAEGFPNVGLIVPICNVLAYLLGPISLAEPPWVAVGATVACVLFLTAREGLHGLAHRIELGEIVNAGRFLLLTGFILPVLPTSPVTSLTTLTPFQVWLAVIAVCSVSYASYLLQRYVVPSGATLLTALLGGFYSSTATIAVLARHARSDGTALRQVQTGIVLAGAVMYPRLLIVIAIFDRPLAQALAPALLGLCVLGIALAAAWYWAGGSDSGGGAPATNPDNPLELGTAAIFAAMFVVVSIVTAWAMRNFGTPGVYSVAAIVGVTDINPFVLTLAQHGAGAVSTSVAVVATLVATASNNLFQAIYAASYSGGKAGLAPPLGLALLAAGGIAAAVFLAAR